MNIIIEIGKVEDFTPVIKLDDNQYVVNFEMELLNPEEENDSDCMYKSFIYDIRCAKSIISIIEDYINSETEHLITTAFRWNGYSVNLSKENQMNYKAAYDLAMSTRGESLPFTARFNKGQNAELYTFDTLAELKDFYIKMNKHINDCLLKGWNRKDAINKADYKI